MKNPVIKITVLFVLIASMSMDAAAQRRSTRRGSAPPPTGNQQEAGNQQQNNNNTAKPTGYNPYGNIPIRKEGAETGGDSVVRKSLRPDAAFDKSFINDRTPLPYEHLRWDDALFAEKVWRELDLREKMNQPFRYDAQDDNGEQRFISILLQAVQKGDVVAFADDRFTTPLDSAAAKQLTAGGMPDTNAVYDIDDPSKIKEYVVTSKAFDSKSVMKLRIKEEWVFDREASRMFVRIIGIAPLKTIYQPDGVTERGTSTMFWVYYPDLRPTLARYEVYNPKNMGTGRMTWEELFESRMFSSYITKSTLDNPSNKTIRQMIKDPILQLLEGDNIKERIFNYEQDLWSY